MSLWKNRPKCSPNPFCQSWYIFYTRVKNSTKILATSLVCFKKPAQSKQSPIGRKFAQSGHPGKHSFFRLKKKLSSSACAWPWTFRFPRPSLWKFVSRIFVLQSCQFKSVRWFRMKRSYSNNFFVKKLLRFFVQFFSDDSFPFFCVNFDFASMRSFCRLDTVMTKMKAN
jgi:hypothetical protein